MMVTGVQEGDVLQQAGSVGLYQSFIVEDADKYLPRFTAWRNQIDGDALAK
jgi:hypothetical protein